VLSGHFYSTLAKGMDFAFNPFNVCRQFMAQKIVGPTSARPVNVCKRNLKGEDEKFFNPPQ
jgi:hypothetical protein